MPFAGLAFKIMNDPFVGSLTFVRIYSGKLEKGDSMMNSTKGKNERVGRMMMMHSNNREEITEAFAGDIIALGGLKDTTTGDTLCDKGDPVVLETMTFPDPGHRDRGRAEDEGRPGEDGAGAPAPGGRGSVVPRRDGQESGQTIMKGMGELAPRHPGRPHEARVQGRGQYRRAAGGLPRDHRPRGRAYLHPQEAVGRVGPVRGGQAADLPDRAGRGLQLRVQDRRRRGSEGIRARRREGHPVGHG